MTKLPLSFYLQENVIKIAKDLIGKVLVTNINGETTSGIITETEAYNGVIDKASHAYGGKITSRNKVMYDEGGVAYVYLCYGIHHLFNVVSNIEGIPHAVLIRGIHPLNGLEIMIKRRNAKHYSNNLFNGPGKVTTALNILKEHNGISLTKDKIWIENQNIRFDRNNIHTGYRIGIEYAKEDALLPYRFYINSKEFIF